MGVFPRGSLSDMETPMKNPMKHLILSAAAATALVFAAPAFAEHGHHGMRHEMSSEDMAAFADARIAALKAGLKLSAAQEKNWAPLETALRDGAKAHAQHMHDMAADMKDGGKHDALEMLRHRATMMTTRAAELTKLADTAKPLYDSLDDGQKGRFAPLLRQAMMGMHMGMGHHHGMKHDDMKHDMDHGD